MDYYIIQNNEANGPSTIGQLRAMWNSGTITHETLYCQEGWSEWLPLSAIIEELEPRVSVPPIISSPPLLSVISTTKRGKAIVICLVCVGVIVLIATANLSSNGNDKSPESVANPSQLPLTEVPTSFGSNIVTETSVPPPSYNPNESQEVGVGTKKGLSIAELAAMIGTQLPKGETFSYYSREIRAGVVAFDPSYQLTSYDEATIDSTASTLAGK